MIRAGDIVVAAAGREKGKSYVVVRVAEGYVYLCDGRTRKTDKPKKKKIKHIGGVVRNCEFLTDRIKRGDKITNKEIRYELLESGGGLTYG